MERAAVAVVGLVAALTGLGSIVGSARGEEDSSGPSASAAPGTTAAAPAEWRLDAAAAGGYRLIDIDGAKDKYREDYDLRSGVRLFTFEVAGSSAAPDTTRLDRFRLEVETPGDEPVSRFRLTAADRSLYDLRADFQRSRYFYAVPQLFADGVSGDVRLDDLHDFDFTRTNGAVDLTLRAPGLPKLLLGYRLYERRGDGLSTVNVPGGDTFVVEAPVDSVTHVGRLGTEFTALDTDVHLVQEYRRVNRRNDLGPVRSRRGVVPDNGSQLTLYDKDQDEEIGVPATTLRLRRALGERAELTGGYFFSHADLDLDYARRQSGRTTLPGFPGTTASNGSGNATLDTHVVDLGTSVTVTERVRLHLDYRYNDRNQDGALDEQGTFGALAARTGNHVRVHSVTHEVELSPREDLSLRAGVRYARRDARFTQSAQDITTDTVGAVANLRYRPWEILDLFARYDNVQIDDPFTVPGDAGGAPPLPEREIALTFTNRGRLGFQLTPRDWVTFRYELQVDDRENDTFAAHARALGNSVAFTVTPVRGLTLFTGYTHRDFRDEAEILIAPLYARTQSLQDGHEDVLASELRYEGELLGQRWSTGWTVAYVLADTTLRPNLEPGLAGRKRFDLDRIDGSVFLALHHRIVEPSIEFRMIDYDEPSLPRNDYRATIINFKLTRRFDL